ncbi:MAG: hypothetical protein EX271_01395 [Acidimicrobiales bacterium]|nr:hypothetical protein [Hyphomonadaceae bacterium]RZV44603.1 MAG: hypothetical protein EX271_01395 [Acidimicrobiales bacterium]
MAKYVFAYHGGKMPVSETESKKVMAAWNEWFKSLGPAVIDGGNPVSKSTTVSADGVVDDGGANPLSGYSLIEADNLQSAIQLAQTCPIVDHGSVEIAEAVTM